MMQIFQNQSAAQVRANKLTKEKGLPHVVLHRTFGEDHRYIVGRYAGTGKKRRFIAAV